MLSILLFTLIARVYGQYTIKMNPRHQAFESLMEYGLIDERSTSNSVDLHLVPLSAFPYQAIVVNKDKYCSGAIIFSKAVLTTATCIYTEDNNVEDIIVKVGSQSLVDEGQIFYAKECKRHEYYEYYSPLDNDIGLVFLNDHIQLGRLSRKIPIFPQERVRHGETIIVSGYVSSKMPTKLKRKLMAIETELVSSEDCKAHYPGLITSSMFCLRLRKDTSLSDFGDPAEYNGRLIGISSFANYDKKPKMVVFTNVTYFYRWIRINVIKYLSRHCVEDNGTKK